ncbi:MAG: pantetheine-phosphate adenylyltransferase [Propionibacteriaceae bacterium]
MRRAICPGSFDPVTLGHLDIIQRTAQLFDEVVVAVGVNAAKAGLFTPDERVGMLREVCRWENVRVELFSGLLVDFCRAQQAQTVVKGLRFASDFDHELQMAQMNHRLSRVETVFMPTAVEWSFVSSTLIREIAAMGGDVGAFLPPGVAERTVDRARQH